MKIQNRMDRATAQAVAHAVGVALHLKAAAHHSFYGEYFDSNTVGVFDRAPTLREIEAVTYVVALQPYIVALQPLDRYYTVQVGFRGQVILEVCALSDLPAILRLAEKHDPTKETHEVRQREPDLQAG